MCSRMGDGRGLGVVTALLLPLLCAAQGGGFSDVLAEGLDLMTKVSGHPATPQMIDAVTTDCAGVLKEQEDNMCTAEVSGMMDTTAMAGTMQLQDSFEHQLQVTLRPQIEHICSRAECVRSLHDSYRRWSKCAADGICASATGSVPFDYCRPLMHDISAKSMESQADAFCMIEPGTEMYCYEMQMMLMAHPDCFEQMLEPNAGCSPECHQVWINMRKKYPSCSMQFAEYLMRTKSMMFRMFGANSGVSRSVHEICEDLGDTQSEVDQVTSDSAQGITKMLRQSGSMHSLMASMMRQSGNSQSFMV